MRWLFIFFVLVDVDARERSVPEAASARAPTPVLVRNCFRDTPGGFVVFMVFLTASVLLSVTCVFTLSRLLFAKNV